MNTGSWVVDILIWTAVLVIGTVVFIDWLNTK